jgi:hypothetical protein
MSTSDCDAAMRRLAELRAENVLYVISPRWKRSRSETLVTRHQECQGYAVKRLPPDPRRIYDVEELEAYPPTHRIAQGSKLIMQKIELVFLKEIFLKIRSFLQYSSRIPLPRQLVSNASISRRV